MYLFIIYVMYKVEKIQYKEILSLSYLRHDQMV